MIVLLRVPLLARVGVGDGGDRFVAEDAALFDLGGIAHEDVQVATADVRLA